MVAALGVQAFALTETDAEKKEQYDLQIKSMKAQKQYWLDAADMVKAAERVYMEKDAAIAALDPKDEFYGEKITEINAEAAASLAAIKALDPTLAAAIDGDIPGIWTYDPSRTYDGGVKAVYDGIVKIYLDDSHAKALDSAIAHAQYMSDKLAVKIAEAAAAAEAAEAAAKLEAAAIKAAEAAVKNPKTSAEWLAYWAAYDKVYADNNLATAKKAAETAKASVATAQKAAIASAKVAVTEAQAVAYNNMQAEIVKAVDEYVAGVNTALAEFYAGLYE